MKFTQPQRREPGESIVPMINVVFLLLIFFLMTAQIAPPEPFDVTPPDSTSENEAEGEFTLYLDADGQLAFKDLLGEEAALASLAAGLKEACPAESCNGETPPRVILRADAEVPAGTVAGLLPKLGAAGLFAGVACDGDTMRTLVEAGVFVALAAGLHLLVLGINPPEGGVASAGDEGESLISLRASNAALVEMVEDWEKPPEPVEIPEMAEPERVVLQPEPVMPSAAPDVAVETPPVNDIRMPEVSDPPAMADVALPPPPDPKPEVAPPEPVEESKLEPTALAPEATPKPEQRTERPVRKAAPAKPQPSAPRAAQKAAGAGGGATAGETRKAEVASTSKAEINSQRAAWGAALRARIERRKRYPRSARGAEGTVTVRFVVSRDGALQSVALVKSSGNPALDQAALDAVRANRRLPGAPGGLTDAAYTFSLPMNFSS